MALTVRRSLVVAVPSAMLAAMAMAQAGAAGFLTTEGPWRALPT